MYNLRVGGSEGSICIFKARGPRRKYVYLKGRRNCRNYLYLVGNWNWRNYFFLRACGYKLRIIY